MFEKLLLVIMAAVLSGLSAWWAGRLGVRRALEQKKAERAFERRLDWYERATRAVTEHATALQQLVVGAENHFNDATMSGMVDNLISKQAAVSAIIGEARMYSTKESALSLAELSRTSKLLLEPKPRNPNDRSEGFTIDVARIEEAAALAMSVASRLAVDVRSHVGLETWDADPSR
jgi:hypothetical protein